MKPQNVVITQIVVLSQSDIINFITLFCINKSVCGTDKVHKEDPCYCFSKSSINSLDYNLFSHTNLLEVEPNILAS